MIQYRNNRRVYRNGQCVTGESLRVDALAFGGSGHGENLGSSQHLAEALVLAEIERASPAVIDFRNHHRAAISEPKFIAHERRNAALIGNAFVVKIVARVEGGVAGNSKKLP